MARLFLHKKYGLDYLDECPRLFEYTLSWQQYQLAKRARNLLALHFCTCNGCGDIILRVVEDFESASLIFVAREHKGDFFAVATREFLTGAWELVDVSDA